MTYTLHLGDCLDLFRTIDTASVDCIVADPPYSINTKSDGQGKLNPWADRINSAFWYREWMGECRRVLKNTGCMWSFFNWRSFVTFQKASDDLSWPIESLLVWDKCWIGPGGHKGLRPSYEFVGLWAMDKFTIPDRSLPDIARFKWSSDKPSGHPAEKPANLVSWLIEISTKQEAVILDPFCGSGTSAESALTAKRNFIGFELDSFWHKYAEKRAQAAAGQSKLFYEVAE